MDGQTDGFAITISRSPWIGMLTRYKKKDLKLQRITNVTILLMIFSQINLVQSPSKNMTQSVHKPPYMYLEDSVGML